MKAKTIIAIRELLQEKSMETRKQLRDKRNELREKYATLYLEDVKMSNDDFVRLSALESEEKRWTSAFEDFENTDFH